MRREMNYKIRESKEFREAACEIYKETKSCRKTARRMTHKYGFDVSDGYITRIVKEYGLLIHRNGPRTYSIYDAELGRL